MAQSNTLQYSCLTSLPSAPIDSKNSTYNSQDSEAKHMHSSIEGTPLSKQPVLPHVPVLEKNTPTSDQENFKFDSSFLHSNQKDLSTSDHLSKNDKLEKSSSLTNHQNIGSVWAQLVDDLFDTRKTANDFNLKILRIMTEKRRELVADIKKYIDDVEKNTIKNDRASFYSNLSDFIFISTGIVGGLTLFSSQATAYQGGKMLLGSFLSMGSFALKQQNYDLKYSLPLKLLGLLGTGSGVAEGFAGLFTNELPKNLAKISSYVGEIANLFATHIGYNSQKELANLQGTHVTLNYKKELNQNKIQEAISKFKIQDLIELSKAVSESMESLATILEKILRNYKIMGE